MTGLKNKVVMINPKIQLDIVKYLQFGGQTETVDKNSYLGGTFFTLQPKFLLL